MCNLLENKKRINSVYPFTLLLLFVFFSSCKKDKDPVFDPGTNEYINDWVLDSMKVYYYWSSALPNKPNYNQDPLNFFSSIKNGADRFSQLFNPDRPESYPSTLYSYFGIDLVNFNTGGEEQTLIRLVVPGSDGFQLGLKRGDQITGINGTPVNSLNISPLSEASLKKGSITLQVEGKTDSYTINTYPVPNPVYNTQIWDKGSKKVGYVFLNNFEIPALSRLKQVFANFQSQQVNELILDMRYNTGGEVSVAAAVAAMICPATENDIFLEYRGNAKAGIQRHSFGNEIGKLFTPVNYNQYSNLRLNINRIFILTGAHTASAAELLANNLSPYIQTLRIGEQTLGKDMASFEIKDLRNPKQAGNWVIWPLVFKAYNAQGHGDYSGGLLPDIATDELSRLPLKELGDPDETLTRVAISRITGASLSSRTAEVKNLQKSYDSRDKEDLLAAPLRVLR